MSPRRELCSLIRMILQFNATADHVALISYSEHCERIEAQEAIARWRNGTST